MHKTKVLLLFIFIKLTGAAQDNLFVFTDPMKDNLLLTAGLQPKVTSGGLSVTGPFCNNKITPILKNILPDTTDWVSFYIFSKNDSGMLAAEYRLNTGTYTSKWNTIPVNHELIFHALSAGQYNLEVRKSKAVNPATYDAVRVNFVIDKKWYKKIPWQLFLMLLLILFLYSLIKLYYRHLFKNRMALEQKILERTTELHSSNEALKNKIVQLDKVTENLKQINLLRERLINILSHDVHSPLRFSTMVGKAVLTNKEELSKDEIIDALTDINQTGVRVLLLISNVLKWAEYQKGNFSPQFSNEDVMQMVQDKIEFFRFMADTKNIQLINNVPPNTIIRTDKTVFGVIVQNLLNNAIKFTSEGEVEVRLDYTVDTFTLTVADTGKGMPEESISAIKKGNAIPLTDTENLKGNGLGWSLINELLVHLQGTFDIRSGDHKGTTVTITFPL
jgi:signal transduction histidine kinase